MSNLARNAFARLMPVNKPEFLVLGAQKAGTTALFQYLSDHPNLAGPTQKEINFFSCDSLYKKGTGFYHSYFPRKTSKTITTFDASPSYLHNINAYHRIFNYNPDIKMIILLRDPIQRAFSAWNMYKRRYLNNREWFYEDWVSYCNPDTGFTRRSNDTLFNFNKFVKEEISHCNQDSPGLIECPILFQGLYHQQITRFYSLFEREQFLIIESMNLRNNTSDVIRKIESFLGIDHADWEGQRFKPVFEGTYSDLIDEESRAILAEYYRDDTEKLFSLLNTKFQWATS